MLTQAPKGTRDVLPKEIGAYQAIEAIMHEVASKHGMREVRTPVFEHTELFMRSVGDTTDIVQKEMYTFMDKGDRSITLKPEGTAGVVRALVEHGLYNEALPLGMYYVNCPVFRYESPQSGRLREHHQFGVEVFGAPNATMDAEIITLALEVIQRAGIRDLILHINSIGCPACRPTYQQKLREHFDKNIGDMCEDCKGRYERNPMRLLDCKDARCKPHKHNAPTMLDCLCEDCQSHFTELKACLDLLDIAYEIDPGIVRGLDYYSRTVFEIIAKTDKGEITACGGGRYDGLVEQIGGPSIAGIGFGMGIERLLMIAKQQGIEYVAPPLYDVMVLSLGSVARMEAFSLAEGLRQAGLRATCDHVGRSLKAQFKYADKMKAPYCVILAPDEMDAGVAKLRNMSKGSETMIARSELIHALVYSLKEVN